MLQQVAAAPVRPASAATTSSPWRTPPPPTPPTPRPWRWPHPPSPASTAWIGSRRPQARERLRRRLRRGRLQSVRGSGRRSGRAARRRLLLRARQLARSPGGEPKLGDLPDDAARRCWCSSTCGATLKLVISLRGALGGAVSPDGFLVRLNLSTQDVQQYVGAQIVQAQTEDEVQVRGIEMSTSPAEGAQQQPPGSLSGVQGTKLQYVSNQPFNEAELLDLCAKIRGGVFDNLTVAVASARIECMSASLRAAGLGATLPGQAPGQAPGSVAPPPLSAQATLQQPPIAVSQVVPPAVGPIAPSSIAAEPPMPPRPRGRRLRRCRPCRPALGAAAFDDAAHAAPAGAAAFVDARPATADARPARRPAAFDDAQPAAANAGPHRPPPLAPGLALFAGVKSAVAAAPAMAAAMAGVCAAAGGGSCGGGGGGGGKVTVAASAVTASAVPPKAVAAVAQALNPTPAVKSAVATTATVAPPPAMAPVPMAGAPPPQVNLETAMPPTATWPAPRQRCRHEQLRRRLERCRERGRGCGRRGGGARKQLI